MTVRDALLKQKQELELRRQEHYIERTAEMRDGNSHLIRIVIGPRRAGKSFFVTRYLMTQGHFGYVNFDDEELNDAEKIPDILTAVADLYPGTKTLLLDEIQNIPGWELLANRLARQGYTLYITGSNAHLLSKELATHLTGRHTVTTIFPFSFAEFLRTKRGEYTESEYRAHLLEYSASGGFPEILMTTIDKKEYLLRLFDAVIYKDIIRRYKVRSPQGLGDLAQYLCSNVAGEYSVHRLSRVTDCRSDRTVRKYLDYLEEAFLFFSIPRFSYKVKEQVLANKKCYCIDNGFVMAKGFRFSRNDGSLMENLVAIALHQLELADNLNLYYWKNANTQEVDFVLQRSGKIIALIQVCTDLIDDKVRRREVNALLTAGRDCACENRIILTMDEEHTKAEEWFGIRGNIQYIPLWKWLKQPEIPGT
ncbi:MAG: ATP-binding protein [Methanoregula sp.]|nr:ATP-binding protein [Methanoregula sp.]